MADTERQRGKCSEREKMGDGERETDMDLKSLIPGGTSKMA